MRAGDLEVGCCFKHDGRSVPCLITKRVLDCGELAGYEYVPWRGSAWAEQTNPARFIKVKPEYAGEKINFKTADFVANPLRRIVIVEL